MFFFTGPADQTILVHFHFHATLSSSLIRGFS
jgi:hypothetical protein